MSDDPDKEKKASDASKTPEEGAGGPGEGQVNNDGGKGAENSEGAFSWLIGDGTKLLRGLLVPTILALVVIVCVWPIKWVLGILTIEEYLHEFRNSVAQTEDTIFSYQYDFDLPLFAEEQRVLASYEINRPVVEVLNDASLEQLKPTLLSQSEDRGEEDYLTLKRAKIRLESPVTKTFPFSSAENALVAVGHSLECFTRSGNSYRGPIAYTISVNGTPLLKKHEGESWQELDPQLISNFTIAPVNRNYMFRQHSLKLEVFPRNDTILGLRMREALSKAEVGESNIERCAFSAMILVRDNPKKFEPGGVDNRMLSFLQRKFGG